jgi:hypothetical protein
MLATVLTDSTGISLQTRQFSGMVLKNMLKNHLFVLKTISSKEIDLVKEFLFKFMVS